MVALIMGCNFLDSLFTHSINSSIKADTFNAFGGTKFAPEILTPEVLNLPAKSFSILFKTKECTSKTSLLFNWYFSFVSCSTYSIASWWFTASKCSLRDFPFMVKPSSITIFVSLSVSVFPSILLEL